jgi:RNA polymerase sigma-70 factor, ECF subfamily
LTPHGTTGETTTDWSLLARIGRKDEEALSALYDRYGGLVFSETKRILHDTGAAEEILQDLFFQVWRMPEKFDPAKGSLAGWLLVAARNRAISKLRRSNGASEELDEKGVAFHVNVESHAAQNLIADTVRAVMTNLPENQREALECAYFGGMTHSEIADKTGEPRVAVKTGICSAMEALKRVVR